MINKDGKHVFGKFYSWELIDSNTAVKSFDKSLFSHRVTGIPKEIAWFFDIGEMARDKKTIHLIYCNKSYNADLVCLERDGSQYVRLLWHADLGNELLKAEKDFNGSVQFVRSGKSEYKINLLRGRREKKYNKDESMAKNLPIEILGEAIKEIIKYEQDYINKSSDKSHKDLIGALNKNNINAANRIQVFKKWKAQLRKIKNEMALSEIFLPNQRIGTLNSVEVTKTQSDCTEMRIGQYIQETLRILEKSNFVFSEDELGKLLDKSWSKKILNINYPLFKSYDPLYPKNKQIIDSSYNNRYWINTFSFNRRLFFVCSQWYFQDKKYFDDWILLIANRHNITFPKKSVVTNADERKSIKTRKQKTPITQEQSALHRGVTANDKPENLVTIIIKDNIIRKK